MGFHRQIWVNGEMNYDDEGDLDGMGGQGTGLEVLGMVVVDVAVLGKVGGGRGNRAIGRGRGFGAGGYGGVGGGARN